MFRGAASSNSVILSDGRPVLVADNHFANNAAVDAHDLSSATTIGAESIAEPEGDLHVLPAEHPAGRGNDCTRPAGGMATESEWGSDSATCAAGSEWGEGGGAVLHVPEGMLQMRSLAEVVTCPFPVSAQNRLGGSRFFAPSTYSPPGPSHRLESFQPARDDTPRCVGQAGDAAGLWLQCMR
jgi:hypothetical protein